jgi:FkbM family methyltransferase
MTLMSPYGERAPGWLDNTVMAATGRLPNNWLGLRLAIGLRRIVTMRMEGDAGLDVVRWGLRMRLHPRRNGCEKGVLFTPQMFEVPERAELFAEIARAKAEGRRFMFVDIGANVGMFSMLVASYAGSAADILAFEPEPENLRRLRFNVAANPGLHVRIMPIALGAAPGRVTLEVGLSDRGGTRVRPPAANDQSGGPTVECRPLAAVLKEQNAVSIDALKIDVEGYEDEILNPFFKEADKSLWPRLIVIEDASDLWRSDLYSLLADCGYRVASRSKLNVMLRRHG